MPQKVMKALSALEAEQLLTSALLVTLLAQQERKKNCQIQLSVLTNPQQPMA